MTKFFLISVLLPLIGLSSLVNAQWTQTNGPYGGSIACVTSDGTNIFAGTREGVFLSINNGSSWTAVNNGLTNPNVSSLAISGTNIFAGTYDTGGGSDVFLSTNNGTSWTAVNNGLTNTSIVALTISGTNIFAGTGEGVFLSSNNGSSWTAVNNGLTSTSVYSLVISGTNIYAGTGGGGVWKRPLSEMLSISETNIALLDFSIYPNPASEMFTLNMNISNNADLTLNIYNVMGALIKSETLKQNQQQINTKDLSNGIYLVEIKSKEWSGKQKLIIQR